MTTIFTPIKRSRIPLSYRCVSNHVDAMIITDVALLNSNDPKINCTLFTFSILSQKKKNTKKPTQMHGLTSKE